MLKYLLTFCPFFQLSSSFHISVHIILNPFSIIPLQFFPHYPSCAGGFPDYLLFSSLVPKLRAPLSRKRKFDHFSLPIFMTYYAYCRILTFQPFDKGHNFRAEITIYVHIFCNLPEKTKRFFFQVTYVVHQL